MIIQVFDLVLSLQNIPQSQPNPFVNAKFLSSEHYQEILEEGKVTRDRSEGYGECGNNSKHNS